MRHLCLAKHLGCGETDRTCHAADRDQHVLARGKPPRDVDRFFRLHRIVGDNEFDLTAQHAAGCVLLVNRHRHRFADGIAGGSSATGQGNE